MSTSINTLADVRAFTGQLLAEGVSVHPDTDFADYIRLQDSQPTYSAEEAQSLNVLMNRCFFIAERDGFDIYEEMLSITLGEMGLETIIPVC